ncbi:hypothetical protein AMECASPLE_015664 [Ameca splendens]|uniref:Uncharacterized protein n=1 Tax=Ameca splendens TaxID=208324 RepID=A0ABV1A8C4_9TELE
MEEDKKIKEHLERHIDVSSSRGPAPPLDHTVGGKVGTGGHLKTGNRRQRQSFVEKAFNQQGDCVNLRPRERNPSAKQFPGRLQGFMGLELTITSECRSLTGGNYYLHINEGMRI